MKFSILICSLDERKKLLDRLLGILNPQVTKDVEIITDIDNRQKTIGKKRNDLIRQASGEYVAFIDDDDRVSDNYVESILNAIESSPDCVGIEGIITTRGKNPYKFIHSLQYSEWFQKDKIYYRCPNHLNPIKRSIVKNIEFPEINYGEDKVYSNALIGLLKHETYIDKPIYFYEYAPQQRSLSPTVRKIRMQSKGVVKYSSNQTIKPIAKPVAKPTGPTIRRKGR